MTEVGRPLPPQPATPPLTRRAAPAYGLQAPKDKGQGKVIASHRVAGCIAGLAIGLTLAGAAAAQEPQGLQPDPSPAPATLRPDAAPTAQVAPAAPRSVRPAPARQATATPPARPARTGSRRATRRSSAAHPSRARTNAPTTRRDAPRATPPAPPRVTGAAPAATGSDDGGRVLRAIAGGALLALAAAGGLTLTRTSARVRP